MEKKYALITGAASGLGKAFAQQCAKLGYHLVLIDQEGSLISGMASHISWKYNVSAHVFLFDLTNNLVAIEKLNQIAEDFPISFIINNAGMGGSSAFLDTSFELMEKIISLNICSTTLLTKVFVPRLLQKSEGFVLNISSMAAFSPIAYKNVYPASKSFISSFSLGLKQELSGSSVSVSVLYPGAIMTNFNVSKRIMGLGFAGRLGLLSTDEIAALAIQKTLNKKARIIPGTWNKINFFLMRILPLEFKMKIISNKVKHEISMASAC